MSNIYTSGQYLESTKTWHAEDSAWKAEKILRLIRDNDLHPKTVAELGCGAGVILDELSKTKYLQNVAFTGFDISPQAIELCKTIASDSVAFYCRDLLSVEERETFDILLVIDVFEHVRDYIGFVEKCKDKAVHKIFHIPLDLTATSVLRSTFLKKRESLGHLHYFTADSAIVTLEDVGYEIIDCRYTEVAFGLFRQRPSFKRGIVNIPRWLFSKFSLPFTARLLGGFSLLVLAR